MNRDIPGIGVRFFESGRNSGLAASPFALNSLNLHLAVDFKQVDFLAIVCAPEIVNRMVALAAVKPDTFSIACT